MARKHEATYDGSAQRVYEALRRSIVDLGWSIERADGRSFTIAFIAKRSLMSTKVKASAIVTSSGSGATISITFG